MTSIRMLKSEFKESEIPEIIDSLSKFYEAHEASKIWYTGRTSKSQVFSYDFVGREGANDQEGPGFYFTSDMTDARKYAYPDGIILTCEVKIKKTCPKRGKPNLHIINTLLKNAPDLEDTLANWGDTTEKALRDVTRLHLQDTNPLNAYMQIWYDFYRYSPAEYLKQISKFYSGHTAKRSGGVEHFILYDPSIVLVKEVKNVEDLGESIFHTLHLK